VSDQWVYWLEYNLPPIAIALALMIWARRLWRRQFERADAMLAIARENNEGLRRTAALLEEIRDILKGKV
jgi:hypothetical protein